MSTPTSPGAIQSPSGHSGPRWTAPPDEPAPDPKLYAAPPEIPSKYFPAQTADLPSMEGKTVAVTGSTTGTGFALAKLVVEKGVKKGVLKAAFQKGVLKGF